MSTYYGTPGAIDSLPTPPAAVTITSSTDATPIVVTTATAHGLQTNQGVIINGHTTNTNANGLRLAVVLSSTTFSLYTFAGAAVAGNGSGAGAGGTSQSLGLPGITLPEDAVTDIDAASVNVGIEGLADMTAFLWMRMLAKQVLLKGGTGTLKSGSTMTGDAGSTLLINGALTLDTDGVFAPTFSLNSGTIALRAPQRFGDADNTITVSDGHEVILSTAPTTARILTITAPSRNGLFMDFSLTTSANNPATKYYAIKRSGSANEIVQLTGWNTAGAVDLGSGRVRIIADGGVWRLAGGVGIVPGTDA